MPSGLATRCPACGTVFRVVPDQLRVSEGWVRCGRCSEVFDASRSLTDIDTGEPRQANQLTDTESERRAIERPVPAPPAPLPPGPGAATGQDGGLPAEPAADFSADFSADFAASEPPPRPDGAAGEPPPDPRVEPDDRPSFVVQAERAERWRRPGVRRALWAVSVLATLGLGAQAALEYRDQAAARLPALRPLLEAACQPLGCRVEALRAIDSLAVESSGLVRVERSNLYRLTVALRNRAAVDVALPAMDVSLTDSQGRIIARKVIRLAELGAAQATIGAGREIALQGTLQAAAAAGGPPPETIAGYTIDLFYP